MSENIWINLIFYTILTTFFIYLAVNEKKLGSKIKEKRDKFSELLIKKLNIQKESIQNGLRKTIDIVETLGTALILVLIIQAFYLGNFLVPTGSMIPTIMPGDRLFGDMVSYNFSQPNRGDIIVFREPMQNKLRYTKRLVALPGEKVEINNNNLYIDDKKLTGEKFQWEYQDLGLIKNERWKVPKKGDTVELIDAEFVISEEEYTFAQLQDYTKGGKWFENIYAKKLKFSIDGKVYKEGLSSYITSQHHYEELLKGQPINVNGKEIKILSGIFYISKGAIELSEFSEMIKEDPKILKGEIRIVTGEFLLNDEHSTGPIMDRDILKKLIFGEKVTLENDYFFVMGDNSKNSLDSRYWGFVNERRIMGRPFFRFWPITDMGLLK